MSENYTFSLEVLEILLLCFQIQGTVNKQLLHSQIWKFSDLKYGCYIKLETHQKNPITSEIGRWSTFEAISSTSQIVKYAGTLIPIIKNDCILSKNTINFLLTFIYMRSKISSVQFSHSIVSDSVTTWTTAHQASTSITNSWSLPKLMSFELVMLSNHLILCRPLLLLPSIFPNIKVFSNESALRIRWPKYWSFSFNISPSNEHPGLISFRMDWLDLPAVQGTLKSLLQHHTSKASILWRSAFFTVLLSHPYMTTGKTIALTRWTFWQTKINMVHSRVVKWSSTELKNMRMSYVAKESTSYKTG